MSRKLNKYYLKKRITKKSLLLIELLTLTFFCFHSNAQVTCGSAFVQNVCITNNTAIGTPTELNASYIWYKDGKPKRGPIAGDGGAVSFNFPINSIDDVGFYTIEKTKNGVVTCAQNIQVVLVPLPVPQVLTGASILCNGETTLSLANTEAGVTYTLYRDNNYVDEVTTTTSGPYSFYPVYSGGLYTVKAYKTSCSPFYTVDFGNIQVNNNLPLPVINTTTSTTAIINWTGTGSYILEYGAKGFSPGYDANPGIGGTIINTSATSVTLSGLISGNSYDIYFRQICSPGIYATSLVKTFTTDCSPTSSFPYTQGFETTAYGLLPACWRSKYADSDADFDFYASSGLARTGSNSLAGQRGMVILPRMTLNGNQRLRFFANAGSNSTIYSVKISTSTNAQNSFTTTLFTDTVYQVGYREKTISLSAYTGAVYIAIQIINGSLRLDDIAVEAIPACGGPSFVTIGTVSSSSAQVNWKGTGSYIIEYGLPGFTPGLTSTAGAGGTILSSLGNSITITGLAANTLYDVYVRQNCTSSANGYSSNSGKISFSTFYNCATATTVGACTNVVASFTFGTGQYDFSGAYPVNSNGKSTPGKELLYQFTPATTGVYTLYVTTGSTSPVSYLYKPASAGCSNTGWIGINSINFDNSGYHAIGQLQAGVTYLFLLDVEVDYSTFSQTFKICPATVGTGSSCLQVLKRPIPANSTKKEYIIDNAGSLIAELDFSATTNAPGNINFFSAVNYGGNVYKDKDKKEYMKRAFNIMPVNSPQGGPIGVKLYFLNTELQQLINDPHDGIADINGIGDLGSTVMADQTQSCTYNVNPITIGSFITPVSNGIYNAQVSYIQFNTSSMGAFYLNGGSVALTPDDKISCPGSSFQYVVSDKGAGATYQWQVDPGTGYINLSNLGVYSGVDTKTLNISLPPTSFYGFKYRCISIVAGNTTISNAITLRFSITWTGAFDTNWSNPRNWSCSSYPNLYIPDANTDVIIESGTLNDPVISTNLSCRSLLIKPGATLTIDPGNILTITGKGN